MFFFFFKQKTAYEMRISDWSSDVCSSDVNAESTDDAEDENGGRHNRRRNSQEHDEDADQRHIEHDQHSIADEHAGNHAPEEMRAVANAPGPGNHPDRKSVGEGKNVSVRVYLGGSQFLKKKKK